MTVEITAAARMLLFCACGGVVLCVTYATGSPCGVGCPHNHAEGCRSAAAVDRALARTPWGAA